MAPKLVIVPTAGKACDDLSWWRAPIVLTISRYAIERDGCVDDIDVIRTLWKGDSTATPNIHPYYFSSI